MEVESVRSGTGMRLEVWVLDGKFVEFFDIVCLSHASYAFLLEVVWEHKVLRGA